MARITRRFTDDEVLDGEFPDIRLMITRPADHRLLRHAYYRRQVATEKSSKAVQIYNQSWVGVLHKLWMGKDTVEEES